MRATDIITNMRDCKDLVLASRALRRWYERLCGDHNGCVFYNEDDGHAYYQPGMGGKPYRVRDMGKFHKTRIALLCERIGLHYFIQSDPRGPALYVANVPLTKDNYLTDGEPIA